jgi:hypothetical protein
MVADVLSQFAKLKTCSIYSDSRKVEDENFEELVFTSEGIVAWVEKYIFKRSCREYLEKWDLWDLVATGRNVTFLARWSIHTGCPCPRCRSRVKVRSSNAAP